MCYVYILRCVDGKRYYGYTIDLKNRLREHNIGLVKSTKGRRPVELVYYRKFNNKDIAIRYEKSLKNGRTRKEKIEKLIQDFSKSRLAVDIINVKGKFLSN